MITKKARKYYDRAVKSFKRADDIEREGIVLSLIAGTYKSQGAWEDALLEYKRSFKKFDESGYQDHDEYAQITRDIEQKTFQVSDIP